MDLHGRFSLIHVHLSANATCCLLHTFLLVTWSAESADALWEWFVVQSLSTEPPELSTFPRAGRWAHEWIMPFPGLVSQFFCKLSVTVRNLNCNWQHLLLNCGTTWQVRAVLSMKNLETALRRATHSTLKCALRHEAFCRLCSSLSCFAYQCVCVLWCPAWCGWHSLSASDRWYFCHRQLYAEVLAWLQQCNSKRDLT